jgi:putative membrane-bound dehydrogenase-like protein
LCSCWHSTGQAQSAQPEQVRVLFLGDKGHHHPADRFKQLGPVLAGQGIEMIYTDSLADLNPARLTGFDCLAIYANHTKLAPEQEKAILDFVAAGGGLVALHCASYCFLNSPAYIELVGGQFKSHQTGVFKETIVDAKHPVMQGLAPIESWDETYVHTRHNTNRVVLSERRYEGGAEPYTWVRQHGKGRVFYTAWGHDERTWSNTGFQALVRNGIRWAGANSPTRLSPRAGLKPFEYMAAAEPLPNYLPDVKWGTLGEPIRTMQQPLAPAESMNHLVTLPDFKVSLFASEPDIIKPIWMAWDERGRLWIAETVDYPNNMQPAGEGHDRIKICEDTDGDGRADKFTIFCDHLSIPTSFVFASGGLIVIHSGKTEFFKDTDGDGRADEHKVLFSGWGINDTHATANNLRYGFDGWIWGTVGYSGFRGTVGGKEMRFGQGIFRFKPDGSALEFVRSSNNNTWGLGITEDNLIFGSTANGNASMFTPIPKRYYEAVNGWSAARLESIADSQRFYPITEKVRQVDYHGRYTAGSGSGIYTARQFPREYWNRAQFVAEPTGHLLGRFWLEERGTDFIAHNLRNFAASDDEWTSPIYGEAGPDGALWMVDWYSYIIQHNPTPRGSSTGKGSAYETRLRDKTHGRIYRITYNQAKVAQAMRLDQDSPKQLVAALKNDNLFWRMQAQRLIVERGDPGVIPALCELIRDDRMDEIGLNPAAIHSLWALNGLGAFADANTQATEAALEALRHPSAAVRRAAVMVLPRDKGALEALLKSKLTEDPNAQVRLATLLAISEMPPADAAASAVFGMLQKPENADDRWIPDAAVAAAARNDVAFIKRALASPDAKNPSEHVASTNTAPDRVLGTVSLHYAQRGTVKDVVSLLAALTSAWPPRAEVVLDALATGWPVNAAPTLSNADKESLSHVMERLPDSARDRLLALAQRWGQPELFAESAGPIVQNLKKRVANSDLKDDERSVAAKRLIGLQDAPATSEFVLSQITLISTPALASGLINALGEGRNSRTGALITERWGNISPAARPLAIAVLLRRGEWSMSLLDAVEQGKINGADLTPGNWAQLKQSRTVAVVSLAEKLSGTSPAISADREEIVRKLLPLAKEKGDLSRGKEVFKVNCANCHTFNGQGARIGPDLTGIAGRDRSEILTDILDPNRSVEANYRLWNVTTKDAETFSGRLETETQTSVEILDTTGQKHTIQRQKIASMQTSQLSIMPTGFEALPAADLVSLLDYLTSLNQ